LENHKWFRRVANPLSFRRHGNTYHLISHLRVHEFIRFKGVTSPITITTANRWKALVAYELYSVTVREKSSSNMVCISTIAITDTPYDLDFSCVVSCYFRTSLTQIGSCIGSLRMAQQYKCSA